MCGRFDLNEHQLPINFDVDLSGLAVPENGPPPYPAYNIAPTNQVLTILSDGAKNHPRLMRWGLVPRWSKEINSKYTMINARDDRILTTRSYTGPFKNQRCLIPASGFYEWKRGPKQARWPMRFTLKSEDTFAFAGIWERAGPGDNEVLSCSIITTAANRLVGTIHERMPVILAPGDYQHWMDPQNESVEDLLELLQSYDADLMKGYPVSNEVNNAQNQGPHLVKPVGPELIV